MKKILIALSIMLGIILAANVQDAEASSYKDGVSVNATKVNHYVGKDNVVKIATMNHRDVEVKVLYTAQKLVGGKWVDANVNSYKTIAPRQKAYVTFNVGTVTDEFTDDFNNQKGTYRLKISIVEKNGDTRTFNTFYTDKIIIR